MPLDLKQTELFDALFGKRHAEIMASTAAALTDADKLGPNEAPIAWAKIAEKHAKDIAEAKIAAYIETVDKLNIVPHKDDFLPLGYEIKDLALKAMNTFQFKMKQPFINQDRAWQSQFASALEGRIERAVGHAVPRLKYFIDERSILDEMQPLATKPEWSRGHKLALVGIAIAMFALLATFTVPEVRATICKHSGYLCDQSRDDNINR